MKNITQFAVFFFALFYLGSCTIIKQTYSSGYYIKKNNHRKNIAIDRETETLTTTFRESSLPEKYDTVLPPSSAGIKSTLKTSPAPEEFPGLQNKISPHPPEKIIHQATHTIIKKIKNKIDQSPVKNNGGGKSQLVALLLCLFVGVLGIHRFYLGYVGIGLIQLFTLGGCGIWALIDLIMIITGTLKPKNGEYGSEL